MLSKGPGINWRRPKNRVHFLDHGGSARRWGSAPSPSAAAPVRRLRGHGTRGELDVPGRGGRDAAVAPGRPGSAERQHVVSSEHLPAPARAGAAAGGRVPEQPRHHQERERRRPQRHQRVPVPVPQRALELHNGRGPRRALRLHAQAREQRNRLYLRGDFCRSRPRGHPGLLLGEPHRLLLRHEQAGPVHARGMEVGGMQRQPPLRHPVRSAVRRRPREGAPQEVQESEEPDESTQQ